MALLDAYATITEFRAGIGDKATGADATITAELLSMSRQVERALWLAPGYFNASAANQSRIFDGNGRDTLQLRDSAGFAYCLTTLDADGLKIDSDLDGLYDDYLLDFNDAGVRGLPENAAAHSEPFTAIQLRPVSGSALTTFPRLEGCVKVVGTWGWSAVPQIIKDLVIHRTHELRQGLAAGALQSVAAFDGTIQMQPRTLWLFKEAEALYGRQLPVIR